MTTRREESDGRVVPEGRRKAAPPARNRRGGKATTASEQAGQRDLFPETADSPQGAVPGTETGQPAPCVRYAVRQQQQKRRRGFQILVNVSEPVFTGRDLAGFGGEEHL